MRSADGMLSRRERVNEIMLRIAQGYREADGPPPRGYRLEVYPRPDLGPLRPPTTDLAYVRKPPRVRARKVPGVDRRRRPLTFEHRAKLREAFATRPGHAQSPITRARISASQKVRLGVRMADCHPDRLHFAHGQCRRCFNRDYMRRRRAKLRVD